MTRIEDPSDDDLRWLAFRYVADELTDQARNTFERRLAQDAEACAAVAEVVGLLGACLQLGPSEIRSGRGRSRRPRIALALAVSAAAAGILMACLPPSWFGDRNETIALERAWSGLQRGLRVEASESTDDDWMLELATVQPLLPVDDDSVSGPPSWLLAAVELAADRPDTPPKRLEN